MSDVRIERVLALPSVGGRQTGTIYLVSPPSDPSKIELWVVGKNINLPRRMPTGSDIETLISDLTSEMRTQIETLQADTTDFTLIFENRLV